MKIFNPADPETGRKRRDPVRALIWGMLAILAAIGFADSAEAKAYGYVFHDGSGKVSIIDTEAQQVVVTVDMGLRVRWFSSRFFDGKRVWAVDGDPKKAEVIVFDPWTLKTLKRIPFGKGPSFSVELTPDHRFAIADAAGDNELVVIDTATYEIVRRIPVGQFPCDLTLSADGKLAFEPDRDQDTISVVDWQSGRVLRTLSLDKDSRPHMLTLSPDGNRLWVQERDASKISIFDANSFERLARLAAANKPATNEFTPSGRYTLQTHLGDNVVMVFETDTFSEVKRVKVGDSPVNSAFRPDGRYAYVTNRKSGTVSVIDTERWEVMKTLEVAAKPFGIYLFDPAKGQMAGNR